MKIGINILSSQYHWYYVGFLKYFITQSVMHIRQRNIGRYFVDFFVVLNHETGHQLTTVQPVCGASIADVQHLYFVVVGKFQGASFIRIENILLSTDSMPPSSLMSASIKRLLLSTMLESDFICLAEQTIRVLDETFIHVWYQNWLFECYPWYISFWKNQYIILYL